MDVCLLPLLCISDGFCMHIMHTTSHPPISYRWDPLPSPHWPVLGMRDMLSHPPRSHADHKKGDAVLRCAGGRHGRGGPSVGGEGWQQVVEHQRRARQLRGAHSMQSAEQSAAGRAAGATAELKEVEAAGAAALITAAANRALSPEATAACQQQLC